jgi:hypothetical protein
LRLHFSVGKEVYIRKAEALCLSLNITTIRHRISIHERGEKDETQELVWADHLHSCRRCDDWVSAASRRGR